MICVLPVAVELQPIAIAFSPVVLTKPLVEALLSMPEPTAPVQFEIVRPELVLDDVPEPEVANACGDIAIPVVARATDKLLIVNNRAPSLTADEA